MAKKATIKETDLFIPVKEYFTAAGFCVRAEVNSCDLVAVKEEQTVIVELKLSANLQLFIQCVKRQRLSQYVFMAIPRPKRTKHTKDTEMLARRLELGLLYVDLATGRVECINDAKPYDRARAEYSQKRKRLSLLKEFSSRSTTETNLAGSRGRKLMTVFKQNSLYLCCLLENRDRINYKQARELGSDAKTTTTLLYRNLMGWFVRNEDGSYSISPLGRAALVEYAATAQELRAQIDAFTAKNTANGNG